jgi:hypothetical protein
MKFKAVVVTLGLFAMSAFPRAQGQTGEIFGRATDTSDGVLPGVTVTLTGPVLLQRLTAVTSETGSYQFPRLNIGTYRVTFDLRGFKTVVNDGIRVTVGFNARVNAQMAISMVQETITVSGRIPIVDPRATGTKQTFTNELLQSIPSARDPWVILQQTSGIAMDRENVGGNMSGQQSNYVSRGGNPANNKWSLDGVDITDMASTGSSPGYYDFDAFEEMTINTGGVDVTQQTGGVGINLVTKSGSDRFRGSSRFYVTDEKFESQNVTGAQRNQGATSGNPIQNIKDYGFELGGPLKKGKAWIWGSFGKQLVDVGVVAFYQPTAACQAFRTSAVALAASIEDVSHCLNTDDTLLQTTNLKADVQLFKGNKLSVFNNFAKKVRNTRGADDLHPIETTTPQRAVPPQYGKNYWTTGPNPTYKAGDQWVVSDRLLMDVQWAHVGNNFILDVHSPELVDVQPTFIISTALNGRSAAQSFSIRPVNSLNVNASYFAPGTLGGDHALKVGGSWRDASNQNISHMGGYGTVRFPNAVTNDCSSEAAGCQVDLARDGLSVYDLTNISAYVQDAFTHGRLTAQLGVRYDRNHDQALAATVAANPLAPTWLPGIDFAGADPGVVFNNFSPRLGLTYDLAGTGHTIARANVARYYGQVGTGGVSSIVNPVSLTTIRYPWIDANNDKAATASEVKSGPNPLSVVNGNWSASNPGAAVSLNSVDPHYKNDTTDELIVGLDREIGAGFAVGASYIWRRYGNFTFNDRVGISSSDFTSVSYTPPVSATSCLPSQNAVCPTVTYFQPNFQLPTIQVETNAGSLNRAYHGFEITGRKRMSHNWLMNGSFAYNSTIVNLGDFAGSIRSTSTTSALLEEDPTNRSARDGYQYDYPSSGAGIGSIYVNAKWLFKLSGVYQTALGVNISAFYNARQGYPYERFVQGPSRPNGGGIPSVLIDPVGESRLPNYQNLDVHVDRPIRFGTVRLIPSLDVFNVANANTLQAIRGTQTASNANTVQALLAPRVMRFGIKFDW